MHRVCVRIHKPAVGANVVEARIEETREKKGREGAMYSELRGGQGGNGIRGLKSKKERDYIKI